MKPALTSTLSPPPYWELDSDGRPNENAYVKTLHFLVVHPIWIQEHPEESTHLFSLIDCTHFSDEISIVAKKAYTILLNRHPQLFPNQKTVLLTTSHPYHEMLISKTQLQKLSPKFCSTLDGPIGKKQPKIELMTEQYDPSVVVTFLKFITSEDLTLTGDNLIPLIYLADFNDIDILKQQCLTFIKNHHLDLCQLLDVLQIGLDLNFKELIWHCLSQFYEEKISLNELNLTTYSSIVEDLLNSIKKIKRLTEFKKTLGEIETSEAPKNLSFLAPLSQFMPVTLDISWVSLKSKDFAYYVEGILKTCPRIQHLIVHDFRFNIKTDCKLLKSFIDLKSFGNRSGFLTSFQDVEEYLAELGPINLYSLNLEKIKDVTDEYLINLSNKFPELKMLCINSDKVTGIPFKHLKRLDCEGCIKITELSLANVENIDCRGCIALKKLSAPVAKVINLAGCEVKEILAPESSLDYGTGMDCF